MKETKHQFYSLGINYKRVAGIFLFFLVNIFLVEINAQNCYPSDKLPAHIVALTDFGQRAEWSLDGKTIYFLDKPGGDVWAVDIKNKKAKQITTSAQRPDGYGYYRVVVLSNGDLLLCGGMERHKLEFEVLNKSLVGPAQKIPFEEVDEGPAVSRKTMKIAWTLPGQRQIFTGKIEYKNGKPSIIEKQLLVDSKNVVTQSGEKYDDILESQNWRGKNEDELIFAQYESGTSFRSEVLGIDLATKVIINYSKDALSYDEPEGIYPGGKFTLVESDKHNISQGTSTIDIYKLTLDGTGKNYERLTYFSDLKGYRSSNPVISDNGRYMAFQGSFAGSEAGGGCGIYLFDLRKYKQKK
jgi:Tol biopolymer transport system component